MATFLRLSSCSSSAIVDMEKVVSISSGDLLYRELLRPNWSSFPDPDNLKNDYQFITVFSDILLLRFLCSQQRKLFCKNWKYSADQQSKREYEINFYVRKMFGFLESTSFEFSCKKIHTYFFSLFHYFFEFMHNFDFIAYQLTTFLRREGNAE